MRWAYMTWLLLKNTFSLLLLLFIHSYTTGGLDLLFTQCVGITGKFKNAKNTTISSLFLKMRFFRVFRMIQYRINSAIWVHWKRSWWQFDLCLLFLWCNIHCNMGDDSKLCSLSIPPVLMYMIVVDKQSSISFGNWYFKRTGSLRRAIKVPTYRGRTFIKLTLH